MTIMLLHNVDKAPYSNSGAIISLLLLFRNWLGKEIGVKGGVEVEKVSKITLCLNGTIIALFSNNLSASLLYDCEWMDPISDFSCRETIHVQQWPSYLN